jgi:hypothetical protein
MRRPLGASVRGWFWAAAVVAATVGCDETKKTPAGALEGHGDDGRWWEGGGGGVGGSGGDKAGGGGGFVGEKMPNLVPSVELIEGARRILTEHCAPCHSGDRGIAYGGFGDIYDSFVMMESGLIVPGDPDASPLYQKVFYGEMPPGGEAGVVNPLDPSRTIGPLSAEEVNTLGLWISVGAPLWAEYPRLTGADVRGLIAADAEILPAAERSSYRYLSLAPYYNTAYGSSDFEIAFAANAVSGLLNALSPSRREVRRPVPLLSAQGALVALRVDLRDYDLDASDWARIEAATEVVDREAFPCAVPFLEVEHFLALASSDGHVRADGRVESVYSNIVLRRALERAGVLGPGQLVFEPAEPVEGEPVASLVSEVTLPQLAAALGVDLAADIAQGAALRACGEQNNGDVRGQRCAQRDAMGGDPGRGFWWTMTFDPAYGELISTPVGPANGDLVPEQAGVERFSFASGVALWPWQNLALGFTAFDDQLRLRSVASEYTDWFEGSWPQADEGMATCFYCHAAGPIPVSDQVRPALDAQPDAFDPAEAEFVRRLFGPQGRSEAQTALDSVAIRDAMRGACVWNCRLFGGGSLSQLPFFKDGYWADFEIASDGAKYFYLSAEEFQQRVINADPELSQMVATNPQVSRAYLNGSFARLRQLAVAAGVDEAALNFCAVPAE